MYLAVVNSGAQTLLLNFNAGYFAQCQLQAQNQPPQFQPQALGARLAETQNIRLDLQSVISRVKNAVDPRPRAYIDQLPSAYNRDLNAVQIPQLFQYRFDLRIDRC